MAGATRHIIRKASLEVVATRQDNDLTETSARWLREVVLIIIGEICDELLPAGIHLRLDELQLDLGTVTHLAPVAGIDGALEQRLRKAIREALRKALQKASSPESSDQQLGTSAASGLLAQWLHYLEYGYLPWWATDFPEYWPERLAELLSRAPSTAAGSGEQNRTGRLQLRSLIIRSNNARRRLVGDKRHLNALAKLTGTSELEKLAQLDRERSWLEWLKISEAGRSNDESEARGKTDPVRVSLPEGSLLPRPSERDGLENDRINASTLSDDLSTVDLPTDTAIEESQREPGVLDTTVGAESVDLKDFHELTFENPLSDSDQSLVSDSFPAELIDSETSLPPKATEGNEKASQTLASANECVPFPPSEKAPQRPTLANQQHDLEASQDDADSLGSPNASISDNSDGRSTEASSMDAASADSTSLSASEAESKISAQPGEGGKDEPSKPSRKQAGALVSADGSLSNTMLSVEHSKTNLPAAPPDTPLYTDYAGVVLLHPYLVHLFTALGYWQENAFADGVAQQRAVYLTYFAATGRPAEGEEALMLAKLLCGWPVAGTPALLTTPLTQTECEEADELLHAVIEHWPAIGKASPAGLREGFFAREGKLEHRERGWQMTVERKGQDILLGKLPWGLSLVKCPWHEAFINVSW